MTDVTRILSAIEHGDAAAAAALLPIVYDELRRLAAGRLARESPGQTMQATALVHEAYLRLVGDPAKQWDGRGHFFAAAAEAMRRILIDRAREKGAAKRGGRRIRLSLDDAHLAVDAISDDLLDLNDALDRLAARDPAKADLVKLRFFAGLTLDEAADVLGISPATADRYWAFARAWLFKELSGRPAS
jgi:RNA polymerase sigma factor (TIGR02999 family)